MSLRITVSLMPKSDPYTYFQVQANADLEPFRSNIASVVSEHMLNLQHEHRVIQINREELRCWPLTITDSLSVVLLGIIHALNRGSTIQSSRNKYMATERYILQLKR